jgi:hypothetical protein
MRVNDRRTRSVKRKYKASAQKIKIPADCNTVVYIKGKGVVKESINENSSTEEAINVEGITMPIRRNNTAQETK